MQYSEAIFQDLVILDLSSVLAGPTAGSFFAELGAKVYKVEHKSSGGDATRQWKLSNEQHTGSISAYYASANIGKEVILLDIDQKEDYDKLLSIVAKSDVVISNFQKRVAEKLKVTYGEFSEINDKIIFAQLNAYSYEDPRPGYDLVMQAETGWISMTGSSTGELAKLPVALMDIIASHQIREAILLSLLKLSKTGNGSEVHISLYKSAISALANQASNFLMVDHVPQPMGTLHPNIAPYGDIFVLNDEKQLILAIGSDLQFEKLGKTLNLAVEDVAKFINNKDRLLNRAVLQEVIQRKLSHYDLHTIVSILSNASVPYCIVKNLNEVFENDLAKSMVKSEVIAGVKTNKVSNIAFTFKK